jgi:hypothetical protein
LGFQDERMAAAYEWMARSVTSEGIAPMEEKQAELHYLANKCGPKFACGMNGRLPCAWGAAKVLLAFGNMPVQYNSPITARAVQQGVRFLLETDPADARYPLARGEKPSQNWWKLGFPLFYITDLLQVVEALVGLGFGQDARLQRTINLILEKQDPQGRWLQEHAYADQTWGNFGKNKQPNQWVTLRALRVLKAIA